MLTNGCIHPQIMQALSLCGHGDQILIADGNYPLASKTGDAEKVYLGLVSGSPTVTAVLEALLSDIRVEAATVMDPGTGSEPGIYAEFRQALPGVELAKLGRFEFYDACGGKTVRLAISTGEKRVYANILLTVGVA
jgi:L-fucose mutarotase